MRTSGDGPPMRVRLFGPASLELLGREVEFGGRVLTRCLFALLVWRYPDGVHREQLSQTLWPYLDRDSARNNLSRRVGELRSLLGAEAWRLTAPAQKGELRLRLDDAAWVDARALREAGAGGRGDAGPFAELDYERGVFLADLDSADLSSADRDWLARQREEMAELYARFRALQLPLSASAGTPAGEPAPPPPTNLPRRNALFTGHADTLAAVRSLVSTRGAVALCGPPGIGKTEVAAEYAHRHRESGRPAFWVSAGSAAGVLSSCADIGACLRPDLEQDAEQDRLAAVARRWLRRTPECLVVLDDAEPEQAAELLEAAQGCTVLLTSAAPLSPAYGERLDVRPLRPAEGAELLLRRSGLAVDGGCGAASAHWPSAMRIAREFGGLPLGLEAAAGFLQVPGATPSEFLALLGAVGEGLRGLPLRGGFRGHRSLAAAVEVRVRQLGPGTLAAELLYLCASLAPDPVPEEVVRAGLAGAEGQEGLPPPLLLALAEASRPGLLARDAAHRTVSMHGLIARTLLESLTGAERQAWARRAVLAVSEAFPDSEFENWPLCARLLPHALACAEYVRRYRVRGHEPGYLLNEAGAYLLQRGRYAEARDLLAEALPLEEEALGPESPEAASVWHNLGRAWQRLGDWDRGAECLERAIAIKEDSVSDGCSKARSLNVLALGYFHQGGLEAAEDACLRALSVLTGESEAEVRCRAEVLNTLVLLRRDMGRYEDAARYMDEQVAAVSTGYGGDHPNMATTLFNRGLLSLAREDLAGALRDFFAALRIRRRVLGRGHPEIAEALAGLSEVCGRRGHRQSVRLARRVAEGYERALGADHERAAYGRRILGRALHRAGDPESAAQELARSLEIGAAAVPAENLDTARTLRALALALADLGRAEEALEASARGLAIARRVMGEGSPRLAELAEEHRQLAEGSAAEGELEAPP